MLNYCIYLYLSIYVLQCPSYIFDIELVQLILQLDFHKHNLPNSRIENSTFMKIWWKDHVS